MDSIKNTHLNIKMLVNILLVEEEDLKINMKIP
jgi:hypothetical protein